MHGPSSVVGIAIGYGLDGPGIESRGWGGEIFRNCPDRPWGPPSVLYRGYRVFPGGKERPGSDADPSPLSSAVCHERVELYIYSPYGPYGLYRASVPVQGYTFFLPFLPLPACKSRPLCVVLNCDLWPVWIYLIFPHYLTNGMIFGRNFSKVECVF
jgi:hypothetical protein